LIYSKHDAQITDSDGKTNMLHADGSFPSEIDSKFCGMDKMSCSSDEKIELRDSTMSSHSRGGDVKKESLIALDGDKKTYIHTNCGEDEWWSAKFPGKYTVKEVRIQNMF
jgi:hypothetical protein